MGIKKKIPGKIFYSIIVPYKKNSKNKIAISKKNSIYFFKIYICLNGKKAII